MPHVLIATEPMFVLLLGLLLINTAGADHAALITYVAPAGAVICGAALLAEPVGPRTLAATALIFVGAWLATLCPSREIALRESS